MLDRQTLTKEQYETWAKEASSRVLMASLIKRLTMSGDGKKLAFYEFGNVIKPNSDWQGTSIYLESGGPKIKDGFVGMAGAYLHPSMVGATSCESVVESWNWLFNQFKSDRAELETYIEFIHIVMFISTGVYETVLNRMMNLAVNLKALHDKGIGVTDKISELNKKIRGNMKAWSQLKDKDPGEGMIRLKSMIDQISDALSESEVALVADQSGMKVIMGKSPDLLIDGIRVEVKHFRTYNVDEGALANKIREGLSQGGEVVVISSSSLRAKRLCGFTIKWSPAETLSSALMFAVAIAKKGKKSVVLYSSTNKGSIAKMGLLK